MRGQLRVGLGLCEPGAYPWDEWATRARAAGVPEDLLQSGRALVREAYQHGWPDPLCVLSGWRYVGPEGRWEVAGEELIAAALKHPSAASAVWTYLLESDGERCDPETMEERAGRRKRPRGWMTLQGCFSRALRQLKAQRVDLLRFPEAGDLVTVCIGDDKTAHIGSVAMAGADGSIVVGYQAEGQSERCHISLMPSADGRAYRERDDKKRPVVVFVVDGKVSEGVLASPFRETPQKKRSAAEAPA